jgi:outer membrane receptor protein involved in Fe transport
MTTFRLTVFAVLCAISGWSQSTAVISGRVEDSSGALVPGASVAVIQQQTDQRFDAVSDNQGRFSFPRLPVGNYRVEVTHPGFRRFESEMIRLDADQTRQANVVLQVGEASESVQVSGAIALVETIGGGLRETVDEKRISELPLNGRNPLDLQLLVPGSVPGQAANSSLGENGAVSINGARGISNNYLLDGGDNNDPQLNTPAIVPNPDSLEEFSVLTNNYSAEYGRGTGAVINAITKSGTNQFHGSAYEFVRNYDFDARNFFSLIVPKLQRNQFGGSLGGPAWIPHVYNGRNHTFFFFSYEGLRQRQASTVSNLIVPTPLERTGDFSQSKLKPTDPTTKAPFPNALIPASRFDPAGQKFLTIFIPLPNALGGRDIYNSPDNLDHDQIILRGDHNIGSKRRLSGRYFHDWSSEFQTAGLPVLTSDNNFDTSSVMGNYTWTVSPSLLNTAQFSFSRLYLNRGPLPVGNNVTYATLGVNAPSDTPQYPTDYRGAVSGYWNLNQNNLVTILNKTYEVFDNVSYMSHGHMLKFGVEFRRATSDRYTANLTDPQFTFNGQFTTNALADFELGLPSVMSQGSLRVNAVRSPEMAFFFQDDWKLRPNLTLSIGVRWEPWFPDYDANDEISVFRPGQQSTVYPTAPPGMLFVGDKGVPKGGVPNDWNNLAPRFGLAWNPTAKTSVRGAYGVFYETPAIHQLSAFSQNQPFSTQIQINAPYSFSDPYRGQIDPFPYTKPTSAQARSQFAFLTPAVMGETLAAGLVDGYMQQWNFSIQRETVQGLVVTAAYVGSKGTKLPLQRELDPALYAPGATTANINQRRIYAPYFSAIADYESNAFSTYHSMQLSLNKRFAHGYTILANYSWAKSIDNDSLDTAGAIQNSLDLRPEKALSDFDVRHRFVASFLWEIPSVKKGWTQWIIGGWQLNGILTLSKGSPFNVVSGQDRALSGLGSERPNLVGDPHLGAGRATDQLIAEYFNPAAYVLPPLGSYGNNGRNTLSAPGTINLDSSLFKMFPIRERVKLQFRAEFFNALNNVNFAAPVSNISTASAGNILSAGSPRILQFGLRLAF